MFRQATVEDISNSRVTKRHGHIVVVTRFYPRYLQKKLLDEYQGDLSPTKALLEEFNETKEKLGEHNEAFAAVDYESKFTLTDQALSELARLTEIAREKNVYLVCHCKVGTRCHREVLMAIAQEKFDAPIAKLSFGWEKIRERFR